MERHAQRDQLSIQDYLEASSDASSRSRAALIALVLASIVAFAAVLHTMKGRWMHQRIIAAADIRSSYVDREIGPYPQKAGVDSATYAENVKLYEHRYLDLCDALEKTDIENFIVSVPFIGFTFDVNDLGILAGIGFLIILTVYRFFLARELENLKLSFQEAKSLGMMELDKFYTLLSMRQVFTVPKSNFGSPSRFRNVTHKVLIWLPVVVLGVIEYDDYSTFSIGQDISNVHSVMAVACGTLGLISCAWMSIAITSRIVEMDKVWLTCRRQIEHRAHDGAKSPGNATPEKADTDGPVFQR